MICLDLLPKKKCSEKERAEASAYQKQKELENPGLRSSKWREWYSCPENKEIVKERNRKNYLKRNREAEAYRQKMRMKDPSKRLQRCRNYASKRGLVWEIGIEAYTRMMQEVCHYCSGPLPSHGCGLDRLDNSKGYSEDNVVPCCWFCNGLRRDALSPEETKKVVQLIMSLRGGGPETLDRTRMTKKGKS